MRGRDARRLDAPLARLLAALPWSRTSGPYQALDLRFALRTTDPALGSYLSELLEPFAVQGPLDDVLWFSALDRETHPRQRFVAYVGERRVAATRCPSQIPAALLWALNQEVVARAQGCLLLHAAAAERDGAVVVLPAPQNSGKTTLCAGLLRRGYRYVTDEAVAVDVTTGRIRPFPKALSLDAGSWSLFADLAPRVSEHQHPYIREQWHVPASRLGAQVDAPLLGVRVLLSPCHVAGAEGAITPLRRAEGLLLLVENSFNPGNWGQAGLAAAARLMQGCAVVGRLRVGDLEQACDIVDSAVERSLATPALEEIRP